MILVLPFGAVLLVVLFVPSFVELEKAIEKLIAKLRKDDPDAAAYLNDVWTVKVDEAIAHYVHAELKAA